MLCASNLIQLPSVGSPNCSSLLPFDPTVTPMAPGSSATPECLLTCLALILLEQLLLPFFLHLKQSMEFISLNCLFLINPFTQKHIYKESETFRCQLKLRFLFAKVACLYIARAHKRHYKEMQTFWNNKEKQKRKRKRNNEII